MAVNGSGTYGSRVNINKLCCDLVFTIAQDIDETNTWLDANHISKNDAIVDSEEAYTDYRWVELGDH